MSESGDKRRGIVGLLRGFGTLALGGAAYWLYIGMVASNAGSASLKQVDELAQEAIAVAVVGAAMWIFSMRLAAGEREHDTIECPFCAERINLRAQKCKHCGSDVASPAAKSQGSSPESTAARTERRGNQRRIGEIRDSIEVLKSNLAQRSSAPNAQELFSLGRCYALLYDETGNLPNRTSALKYMAAAKNTDGSFFGSSFSDTESFGSLMKDAEFAAFV